MSKYKIIERAYSNFHPIKNKGFALIISALFLGFILGILIIVIYYLYSTKILNIKNIENRTDIPIYGTINLLKDKNSKKYNRVRTNLQLLDSKPKIILFSSIEDIEDKEIVVLNLAISFAKVDYKTIIINLDKKYLDYKYNTINQTRHENLDIIPIKDTINGVSKDFLSQTLPQLIRELKIRNYDYIIINTVPFGILIDTINIMKLSDINLILFKEDFSKRESISELNYIKKQNGINNLGIVFLENS